MLARDGGNRVEEHSPRTGVQAAVAAVIVVLLACAAGLTILLLGSMRGALPARASAPTSRPVGPGTSAPRFNTDDDVPASVTSSIAEQSPGWTLVDTAWMASAGTSQSVAALLSSNDVEGFRHVAVYDVEARASGAALVFQRVDAFFAPASAGRASERSLSFQRHWLSAHPDLACGTVDEDLDRYLGTVLTAYTARAFTWHEGAAPGDAGAIALRYDEARQVWDEENGSGLPAEISERDARAVAKRMLPAFRVVSTVYDPPSAYGDYPNVFVLLRHPSYESAIVLLDPLEADGAFPITFYEGSAGTFFSEHWDARSRALLRDWAKIRPGAVLAGVYDLADSGPAFDYIGIEYLESPKDVEIKTAFETVDLKYDRAKQRWREVPSVY